MALQSEKIELLETFIADAYWTYGGINPDIWDHPEYESIHEFVRKRRYPRWDDNWLSDLEKEAADRALRSLGNLPRYGYPTLEDYERLNGIV